MHASTHTYTHACACARTHTHTLNTTHYRISCDIGGKMGKRRQLLGQVVHTHSLLLAESSDFSNMHIHPQRLLATEEIVELSIVVWFTVWICVRDTCACIRACN